MSEVILTNLYHFDQRFKVTNWKDGLIRVTKLVNGTQVHIYLESELLNVYYHDKRDKKGPLTGKVDLVLPSWLYMQYYDFFKI